MKAKIKTHKGCAKRVKVKTRHVYACATHGTRKRRLNTTATMHGNRKLHRLHACDAKIILSLLRLR